MKIDFNLINWENWIVDKDYSGKSKDGEYWDITEVLYCKLDWIKERLKEDKNQEDDNSEFIETLEIVQKILEKLDEEKLKKL